MHHFAKERSASIAPVDSGVSLSEVGRRYILRVLRQTRGRIEGPGGAADILGLHPSTLRSRMRKLGIYRVGNDDGKYSLLGKLHT